MKNHPLSGYFGILFSLLFFSMFISCTRNNSGKDVDPEFAKYISAFTYGRISPQSVIQVELAQELPAVELNREVEEKLFSFSPAIKGKTFWINATTVQFIPDAGQLKPGMAYRANFYLDKVLKVQKEFAVFRFGFQVNEQDFIADVLPYSPITNEDLAWNRIPVTLQFSNPVEREKVVEMLHVEGLSHSPAVRVNESTGTIFHLSIDSIPRTDQLRQYTLVVDGSPVGAKRKEKYTFTLPAFTQEHFEVVDVRLQSGPDQHLRVTFSDPLSPSQDLNGLVTLSGVSNFTFQTDLNIIKIFPESLPKGNVTVTLFKGIRNQQGKTLAEDRSWQVSVPELSPEIKLLENGNILPNAERLLLPFSAVNLWAVDVSVIKIYRDNILYYLQTGTLNEGYSSELRRFGRLVMKRQIRLDKDKNVDLTKWNHFSIDLASLFEQDPGALYLVRLSMKREYSLYPCGGTIPVAPDDGNLRRFEDEVISDDEAAKWDETSPYYYDSFNWNEYKWEDRDNPCTVSYYMNRERTKETFIVASRIGMIAKSAGNGKMMVAVTDILTTEPLSGAEVTVYNYQLQTIGKAKTDGEGFAEIDCDNGRPFVVTASVEKDMGYLEVKEEASLSLSRFDVSGKEIQQGLKGYVYAERGVWRPGDTLYVSFILEDREQHLPDNHPVILEIYTPRGQFYQKQVSNKGVNGFHAFAVATEPSVETGTWQGVVKVGGTSFRKSLRIETIKPNRLKVRLDTDSLIDAAKGVMSGTLSAHWLHGAPASNLKAEVELNLSRSEKPFKGYANYTFNNPVIQFGTSKTKIFEGTLDASGVTPIRASVPVAENAPGLLRGNILSRVYESGGDMSFYAQTVLYSPYERYVGVQSPMTRDGEFLETDTPLQFNVVTVDAKGKRVPGRVDYTIYKLDWSWWWNNSGEDLGTYVNNTAANVMAKGGETLADGKGSISFKVNYPDWGRYLLLVKDAEGKHAAGTIFYVDWPAWRGRSAKMDPEGLTMLSFSTDKPSYEAGEKATVIFPKSSDGRVLVSLENGSGILQREWVKTSASEDTRYTIDITESMAPNFYIFATMLQPHGQTENDLPVRLYGVVNVGVNNRNSVLIPQIRMPETLRPEENFVISISEKDKKEMTYTLAVVDEGLLDLTSFKTPNAWDEFYAKEALGVRTWDLFDRVLGAQGGVMGPLLSIGGDEALNPSHDNINRFNPVVKFLGPFTLKSGETRNHTLSLPQYVGSVRVMVVAGGNGAYGNAEKTVPVKSDLMTLSTLPRVMGPGEEVLLPVNLFVSGNKVKDVKVTVKTKGLLEPVGNATGQVRFSAPGDSTLFFHLKAQNHSGGEQVEITSSGNGVRFTETIHIEIRNPNPPKVVSASKLLSPGEAVSLDIQMAGEEEGNWAALELSRLPGIDFSRNMAYLLEYPHGCTEQIISQGFPLLYIQTFTQLTEEEGQQATAKVNEVIRLLSSRQTADGGFLYWNGDRYASTWVTTYAGHFLIEAKNQGYEVPDAVLTRWAQFQRNVARNWLPVTQENTYYTLSMTDLQQAYRLYSLALYGMPESGAMNRMREISDLSVQARWRLSAAYAIAGRDDVANTLIFNVDDKVDPYTFNNDTYGSAERDRAMILESCLLLGKIEQAMALAPALTASLSSGYVSTQTASFGLVAMAKLAEKIGTGNIDVSWTLNGKKMESVNTSKPIHQIAIHPAENLSVQLSNKGNSSVYARLSARMRPLPGEDDRPIEGKFHLAVHYTDMGGNPIDVGSLKQGTEFLAVVTLKNGIEQDYTNLALTQIFPSGWEIYNDRLLGGGENPELFNYRDIRDDRVLTYFNLPAGGSKVFKIRLQAAYRGRYYLPPVLCEAMYAPQEQARTVGKWVTVID